MSDIVVSIVGKDVVTTSRNVALVFGKQHKDVIRKIHDIVERADELRRRNFTPTEFMMSWQQQADSLTSRNQFIIEKP